MVGYRQTNQKTDTGKTLTRWPVFVDHFKLTLKIKNRMTERKGSFGVLLSRKGEKMETLTKVIQTLKALIVLLELIRWFF